MTGSEKSSSWDVSADAHLAFTQLSGDVNPMHTDRLLARRLPFGQVVVHGIHLLARALDQWAAAHPALAFSHISATFRLPVAIGSALTTEWREPAQDGTASINVDVDGVRAVDVTVTAIANAPARRVAPRDEWRPDSRNTRQVQPSVWTIEELANRRGSLPVDIDPRAAAAAFPHLVAAAGLAATAELITLSTMVGMHAPGLYSMFSSLSIGIEGEPPGEPDHQKSSEPPGEPDHQNSSGPDDSATERLNYSVIHVDPRFARVTIDLVASAVAGRVVAFVRPAPINQPVDTSAVRVAEFAGQRWLIIGGSRGLGAAAVRLLVAGEADVRFTYHQGHTEAAELSGDTGALPVSFDVFAQDIDRHVAAITEGWQPTHLGWFASPPIFVGSRNTYDDTLYRRFVRAYVEAFATAIDTLAPHGLVGALWPSSEAVGVTVPGLAEYSDAKRLGEHRCEELQRDWPSLTISAPRLPRLLTDQSTTFVPTEFGDTATEVLAALRATFRER